MRRWTLSLGLGSALVACLATGLAGSARAATLDFTGTVAINIFGLRDMTGSRIYLTIPGAGAAQVTDDGSLHLLSLTVPGGSFGPATATTGLYPTYLSTDTVFFTLTQNLSGTFTGISGGPPGGGTMGLSGLAKMAVQFGQYLSVPLAPTSGGAGFGIGGTAVHTGVIDVTVQNAPWTIGQPPVMTLHTGMSSVTTPTLPGGFAHGPASLTSSTAQPSGALQLVTVSKVYTNIVSVWPKSPAIGILTLHFVPEPGTLILLGCGVVALAAAGRRRSRR